METMTRWDFSKSRSNYHFDPTINEDDNPPFKIVGRVEGDLLAHLQESQEYLAKHPYGFENRVATNKGMGLFTDELDCAELKFLGLKEDHSYFHALRPMQRTLDALRTAFAFKTGSPFGGRWLIQKPGMMFNVHVDECPNIRGNTVEHWVDKQPENIARLAIMATDWQPGHVYAYGNTYWKQWKAGDIAWHDWRNTPHGTANIGRCDRITLQVTGWTTEQTRRMIQEGNVTVTL